MKNILALNNDGFGCRLAAMLNAIKISQAFGEDFYFRWDWKRNNEYHAVEPKEHVFSQDFIRKYYLNELPKETVGTYRNFFEDYEKFVNFRGYVQNQEFVNYCKKYNVENRWKTFSYKQAFEFIDFSKKYKNIIDKIQSLKLKDVVAVHLRGGDIVYANFNKRINLVVKTTPLPIAIELLQRFQPDKIVFIVQDIEIEHFLKQKYNVKTVSLFYEKYYDKYEKAFFDMMFMSQCKKIIASHSGFSISASYIGENEIVSYKNLIGQEELCKIVKTCYLGLDSQIKIKIPNQHISFDILSLLINGKNNLTKEEYIYWSKCGFEHNEENSTFLILQIFCHYAFGEYDLADEIIRREFLSSSNFKRLILSIQSNYFAKFQLSRDTYFDEFVVNCKKSTYGFFLYCIFMIEFYMKDNKDIDDFFVGQNLSKINYEILITETCCEARMYLKYFFNFLIETQSFSCNAMIDKEHQESDNSNVRKKDTTIKANIVQLNALQNNMTEKLNKNKEALVQKNSRIQALMQDIRAQNNQLSFQTKYGTAKARIQNQLSYKIGQALIANSKSLLGYIRMPFVLSYIKDKHKQEQKIYQEKIKKDPSAKLPPLEAYPDYKEALKEKECYAYKLGEAFIKAHKTWYKGGYLKFYFKDISAIKWKINNKKYNDYKK
ncbi:hypothetical protein [Helicobacter valdiviensis]|uniref:hypothetical protein n=1 Tax=Helicobacter valdiviensis TaxID=1458358 RepID=UPI001FEA2420|nr:hypothetical protein [Helicobacter valdiviensis]